MEITKEEKRKKLEALGFQFDEKGNVSQVPPKYLAEMHQLMNKQAEERFGDTDSVIVPIEKASPYLDQLKQQAYAKYEERMRFMASTARILRPALEGRPRKHE